MAPVIGFLRSAGPTMSAFNAWVFLKGLETLSLRMRAHSASALQLALWLERKVQVVKVNYSGLKQHSGHTLACKQQDDFGGVLSFQVKGSRDAAWRFIDATQMLSLTANLGDSKTTIVHPASTTHSRLSNDQRSAAGITENLIRIAVGLENIEDIKRDLEFGFEVI
jgi:O-succinylhomoserine sulfhydrylase